MESRLVVLSFDGQYEAEGLMKDIERMQDEGLIALEDAVIASRGVGSKVDIQQTQQRSKKPALKGGGVGLLAGILLGGPILGLAGGAAIGAIAGSMRDYGIDDTFIDKIVKGLKPESSALFLLVKEAEGEKVLERLSPFKASVLITTLAAEQEERLRKALEEEQYK